MKASASGGQGPSGAERQVAFVCGQGPQQLTTVGAASPSRPAGTEWCNQSLLRATAVEAWLDKALGTGVPAPLG